MLQAAVQSSPVEHTMGQTWAKYQFNGGKEYMVLSKAENEDVNLLIRICFAKINGKHCTRLSYGIPSTFLSVKIIVFYNII